MVRRLLDGKGLSETLFLPEVVQDLNAGRSFREIFDAIYARLHGRVPCDRLAVAVYDRGTDKLTLHSARSDGPQLLREGYSAALKGSSLEALLQTGEPRILNDLEAHLREKPDSQSTSLIVREGLRSSLTLPLIARGVPIGVLFLSSRRAHAYTPEHLSMMKLVAGHISVALERSLLVEELRANKEYLESILQTSADAIIVLTTDGKIRSWNRGAERMFGWTGPEIVGREFEVLVPEELKGELQRIRESVERDGYLSSFETTRVARDGRRLAVNVTSTAIRDRAGKMIGRSSILRDVTHLKRLQEDLVRNQSLATVGEMAASVAHEIKNPLAGISGAIQVIADAIPSTDPRREIVSEILAQVRRLDDTVRDLLVFARPWRPEFQEIDLVDVIERVATQLRQDRRRKVLVRRETPATLPVTADPRQMQEVLLNLLLNAADAMPSGGLIRVVGEAVDGGVVIRVIDTGLGISAEHRPKLFRPFHTTKTRGTGLGLAISKKIIEGHGGRIEIDSAEGKGTEVRISLPKEQTYVASGTGR